MTKNQEVSHVKKLKIVWIALVMTCIIASTGVTASAQEKIHMPWDISPETTPLEFWQVLGENVKGDHQITEKDGYVFMYARGDEYFADRVASPLCELFGLEKICEVYAYGFANEPVQGIEFALDKFFKRGPESRDGPYIADTFAAFDKTLDILKQAYGDPKLLSVETGVTFVTESDAGPSLKFYLAPQKGGKPDYERLSEVLMGSDDTLILKADWGNVTLKAYISSEWESAVSYVTLIYSTEVLFPQGLERMPENN